MGIGAIVIAIIVVFYILEYCKKNNCNIKDFFFRRSIFDKDKYEDDEDDEDIIDIDDYDDKYNK